MLLLTKSSIGQQTNAIKGRITSQSTGEPLPYAVLYNISTGKGTISNLDGHFLLESTNKGDTIRITFIGFKDQWIRVEESKFYYEINLEQNVNMLSEVTVTPDENTYLYDLLIKCKKPYSNNTRRAKALYELKSYVNDRQIELVEGYYNAEINGYKLSKIHLKTGRVALQQYYDHFYASLESSKAILMLNIFKHNDYFPITPLELNKSKLRKGYYLTLNQKYTDASTDSVYVINYAPKDTSGKYFEGQIWINTTRELILKITLNCKGAKPHPFIPLFPDDEIRSVNFNITESFVPDKEEILFNHIDFSYALEYYSKSVPAKERLSSITTNAVLHVYDYHTSFFQPLFDFHEDATGDYRKISAMPYNDFFWNNHNEYSLNANSKTNHQFYFDSLSVNNKSLFKSNPVFKKGLFEHAYRSWSPTRVTFREIIADTSHKVVSSQMATEKFNLNLDLFLDINQYSDSTQLITSIIFDPYESYYHLPIDLKTHCFVNMYFDYCEIQRIELHNKVRSEIHNLEAIKDSYANFLREYEAKNWKFLQEVQRGTNRESMLRYNAKIVDKLGINNIELFQPYPTEQNRR